MSTTDIEDEDGCQGVGCTFDTESVLLTKLSSNRPTNFKNTLRKFFSIIPVYNTATPRVIEKELIARATAYDYL